MIDEKINKLKRELRFLVPSEITKEITKNKKRLKTKSVKEVAKDVYLKRGIDYTKINNNIINLIENISNTFQGIDKQTRKKMIIDIICMVLILLLVKIPFNLVRDIGYDYIEILSKNTLLYNLWNLLFLILYTITFLCAFILFIKNINTKYHK